MAAEVLAEDVAMEKSEEITYGLGCVSEKSAQPAMKRTKEIASVIRRAFEKKVVKKDDK